MFVALVKRQAEEKLKKLVNFQMVKKGSFIKIEIKIPVTTGGT